MAQNNANSANACLRMIPDICRRLNEYTDKAAGSTNPQEFEQLKAKAEDEFRHLWQCVSNVNGISRLHLASRIVETHNHYNEVFYKD